MISPLTPTEKAIRLMLRQHRGFVSTDILCTTLEVDADSLKALIWKMRKKGLAIESARGQGYRLVRDA